jgi:hypothetical protein
MGTLPDLDKPTSFDYKDGVSLESKCSFSLFYLLGFGSINKFQTQVMEGVELDL